MRAILTYHSIDNSGSPISVSPERFREQVEWLSSGAVVVQPLEQLLEHDGAADAVAITFDDGFANFAEAASILHDRNLPATLFVVSGHVGRTNAWGGREQRGIPTLPLLSWEDLGHMVDAGVAIGAHTRTHPRRLTALSDPAVEDELAGCCEDLRQRLGLTPRHFAYPYGDCDDRLASTAARFFAASVTTELRTLRADDAPARLPRLDMYYFNRPGGLALWGTSRFTQHLWAVRVRRRLREALAPC